MITRRLPLAALASALMLMACDGPHEQAGEKSDAAAGIDNGALGSGPGETVGELQDRTARDQANARKAQADAAEHQADEVRETADQRADALEEKADAIRHSANQAAETLDHQANAIRQK